MRQWHRWLGICFAAFILLIATTGVAIQLLDIVAASTKPDKPSAEAATVANAVAPTAAVPATGGHHRHDADALPERSVAGDVAPKPKPPQSGVRRWAHWIKDLHSGVLIGPVGIAISIVSGVALVFFALSGMWMYWQMFMRRRAAGRNSFFWKR